MNADAEDVANEPQRKRIRRKRPPQPVPVPKVRPMNILDVAPSEESAPRLRMPIRMLLRLLQRRPEMFRLRLLLQRRPELLSRQQRCHQAPPVIRVGRPKNGSYGLKPSEPPTRKAPKAASASFSSTKGSAR